MNSAGLFVVSLLTTIDLFSSSSSSSSSLHGDQSCDVNIDSSTGGQKNGNFSSPNYPQPYPANLRCIYRLTGQPHERVRVEFRDFEVKGVPPRCLNDYVDVYTQVFDPSHDLLDVPLHGRFCGSGTDLLPRILISMHNIFILGFYSDHQKEEKGFTADFTFIDGAIYNVGTPAPSNVCGQTIYGMSKPSGYIYSPTYPGVYPDNVFCFFRLIGVQRQRIKLTFEEIDLYSGGEHCPFDSIQIYDGPWNTSDMIDTYCGHRTNVTVFSSSYNLYVQFVTRSGRIEPTKRAYIPPWDGNRNDEVAIQRRGFKASYEISAHFVDLAFIRDGKHVRGTECDQMVLSKNESTGHVVSPNFPNMFPLGVVCTYYIDGLEDKQNLEKAKLIFELVDIPKSNENNGYLSAYLRGQTDQPDHVICGSASLPLVSSNPRLLLVFNSLRSKYSGHGFKARFQFLTDYAIPGTPATEASKCHFIYRSSSALHGTFNSPRHPSNYPDEAACLYEFSGLQSEQVRITFETFKLENSVPTSSCQGDYVHIYNVLLPAAHRRNHHPHHSHFRRVTNLPPTALAYIDPAVDLLTGIYCGEVLPGPQLSEEEATSVKVLFVTNNEGVNTGFRAKYEFIEKKAHNKRCFYNITSGSAGQIWSPNYPHKYLINSTCEWLITSKHPGGRILLKFNFFAMERSQDKQGCGNAVLKIYSNSTGWPSHELCGVTAEGTTILSEANSLRLRFVSSARAIGAKGFKLTWTEVLSVDSQGHDCEGFRCAHTGYCISSTLTCNKMSNCGKNDNSDETADCHQYQDGGILQISIAVVGVSIFLVVIVIACFAYRKRKSVARKNKADAEVVRNSSVTSPSSSSSVPVCKPSRAHQHHHPPHHPQQQQQLQHEGKIIKEHTEKVSIV